MKIQPADHFRCVNQVYYISTLTVAFCVLYSLWCDMVGRIFCLKTGSNRLARYHGLFG